MIAPERIWAWPWEVNPRMGQWEADRSIAGEGEPYVPEAALTAAQAEIARLKAERDAAMAGRVKGRPLVWVDESFESYHARTVLGDYLVESDDDGVWGMWTPKETNGFDAKSKHNSEESAKAAAQADHDAIAIAIAAIQPDTERAEPVPCPVDSAPKDGTLIRLLVDYSSDDAAGALEDAAEAWTIGFNNLRDTGDDEWQFAGWNWSHDCFTEGHGKVIGWLPFHLAAPAPQDAARVPEIAAMDDQALCEWIEERHRGAILWAIDPDHFTHQIQITPQTLRKIIAALRAIAAMQKGG